LINIKERITQIASQLGETAKNAQINFIGALEDIKRFRKLEKAQSKTNEKERSRFIRAEAGHIIAMAAIKRGLENADKLINLFDSSGRYEYFNKWEELEEGVKDSSKKIHELLHPVENFLSSVLDRELAAATGGSYGGWDVVEIACAAAAYGAVANEWDDDRLLRVADCLKKVISDRGWFPIGRPFHVTATDMELPYNTVAMGALAQILKKTGTLAQQLKQPVAIPVEQTFVKKILYFCKDTRADKPPVGMEDKWDTEKGGKKYGWVLAYTTPPWPTQPLATAKTVQLLGLINEMLDEQINAQVLYHFFVKRPEELEVEGAPTLDTLFYPDYGLCRKPPELISRKNSIAILLQKMRAHVSGLHDLDTLYSLVLHGPQGTGKTTIVEALALSCEVPLVEVTPSDIVVRGQEAVERRARAVFEALSLLTRVVILFDEFDPVLWRRDPKSRPRDVFAFLTPGMLPKLRKLYKTAKMRSVSYVLITNLIGSLDGPTIREGRFDIKMGIYPPDVLSRAGRFWSEAAILMENLKAKDPLFATPKDEDLKARLKTIIAISSGAGMQALNRDGCFRRPSSKKDPHPQKNTLLHYYIYGPEPTLPIPTQLAQDAHLKDIEQVEEGQGPEAKMEYQQWAWVEDWDNKFKEVYYEALKSAPIKVPTVPTI